MRKTTLAVLSFLLSFALVYGLSLLSWSVGLYLPPIGFITHVIAAAVVSPLLILLLSQLNQPLLRWRKTRGRDIELEEAHENVEAGIISIKPRNFDDRKEL